MAHPRAHRWSSPFVTAWQGLRALDVLDLVLRLTLLMFLLNPVGEGGLRPLFLLLAGGGLIHSRAAYSPMLWLGLTLAAGWRVVEDWPLADNHAYLLCYWCLAIACSLWLPDPRRALAAHGKWLIGLVFLLATVWKVSLSPDYLNGTFFQFILLADERFADTTRLVGGLSEAQIEMAYQALVPEVERPATLTLPVLPARFTLLVLVATWWTVILEAAVTLCFVLPLSGRAVRWRHGLLLVFCVTTYAVAPVAGFGWLLLVMGLAQCKPHQSALHTVYLCIYGVMLLFDEFL